MTLSKFINRQKKSNKKNSLITKKNTLSLLTFVFLLGAIGGILITSKPGKEKISKAKKKLSVKCKVLKKFSNENNEQDILDYEDYLDIDYDEDNDRLLESKRKIKEFFDKKKNLIQITKKFNQSNDIVYSIPINRYDENDRIDEALMNQIYFNKNSEEIGD